MPCKCRDTPAPNQTPSLSSFKSPPRRHPPAVPTPPVAPPSVADMSRVQFRARSTSQHTPHTAQHSHNHNHNHDHDENVTESYCSTCRGSVTTEGSCSTCESTASDVTVRRSDDTFDDSFDTLCDDAQATVRAPVNGRQAVKPLFGTGVSVSVWTWGILYVFRPRSLVRARWRAPSRPSRRHNWV